MRSARTPARLVTLLLLAFLAIVKPFPPGIAWFVHGRCSCSFVRRPWSGVAMVDTIHALNADPSYPINARRA